MSGITNSQIGPVAMWGYSLGFWQGVAYWTLFAAFGFGGLAVTASFVSSFVAGKVSDVIQANATAQHDKEAVAFEKYKIDSQHDEDIKIGQAEASAKADADVKIRAASDAANIEIAKAQAEAAKANENTEQLRAQNLALEKAIKPRILTNVGPGADKLRAFAGLPFVVVSPSDLETRRMAGQIRIMLGLAGWKEDPSLALKAFNGQYGFLDGISIHGGAGMGSQGINDIRDVLIAVLKDGGIEATAGAPAFGGEQALVIEVGPNPLPPSLRVKLEDIKPDSRGNKYVGGPVR